MNWRRAGAIVGIAAIHLIVSLVALQIAAAGVMARIEFPAPPTVSERIASGIATVLLFPLTLAPGDRLGPGILLFAANSLLWGWACVWVGGRVSSARRVARS